MSAHPVSGTGRVTRVSNKFAYVTSNNLGSIFVPPHAFLKGDGTPVAGFDLSTILKSGDIVHFTAVPQKGKNDCLYMAIKVSLLAVAHDNKASMK